MKEKRKYHKIVLGYRRNGEEIIGKCYIDKKDRICILPTCRDWVEIALISVILVACMIFNLLVCFGVI